MGDIQTFAYFMVSSSSPHHFHAPQNFFFLCFCFPSEMEYFNFFPLNFEISLDFYWILAHCNCTTGPWQAANSSSLTAVLHIPIWNQSQWADQGKRLLMLISEDQGKLFLWWVSTRVSMLLLSTEMSCQHPSSHGSCWLQICGLTNECPLPVCH